MKPHALKQSLLKMKKSVFDTPKFKVSIVYFFSPSWISMADV
jgi:hypothetical protein